MFTSVYSDTAGRRVGRLSAACAVVRGGRTFVQARFQCGATVILRDGTLTVSGAFSGDQRDENVLTAVTGGTGAYEGARGSVSQRNLPGSRTENTIHLLP